MRQINADFYINYPDFASQNHVEWKYIYINYPVALRRHPFKIWRGLLL